MNNAATKKFSYSKENAVTQAFVSKRGSEEAADKNAIRSFHVNVPEVELTELRGRIKATNWPERGNGHGCIAGRAARDGLETRALLGDRLRLRVCEAKRNWVTNLPLGQAAKLAR